MENTKVTVTVSYEIEYDGKVTEDDIDINDIIRNQDAIKDIKVKTSPIWRSFMARILKGSN